jgi:hypothetical protein
MDISCGDFENRGFPVVSELFNTQLQGDIVFVSHPHSISLSTTGWSLSTREADDGQTRVRVSHDPMKSITRYPQHQSLSK